MAQNFTAAIANRQAPGVQNTGIVTQNPAPGQQQPAPQNPVLGPVYAQVPVVQTCAVNNPSYFVPASLSGSSCFIEKVFFNGTGAPVTLYFGGTLDKPLEPQTLGLANSFIDSGADLVDGVIASQSTWRYAVNQTQNRPIILNQLTLSAPTAFGNNANAGIFTFSVTPDGSICKQGLALPICSLCPWDNTINAKGYSGSFFITPTTGIGIVLPAMAGDGNPGVRIRFDIGSNVSFAYNDCNDGNVVTGL